MIVSYQDVTEHHRNELAYLRQKQTLEQTKTHMGQLEADLNTDLVEMHSKQLVMQNQNVVGKTLTSMIRHLAELLIAEEDRERAIAAFSPKHLLDQYAQGNRVLESTWEMRSTEGRTSWVQVEVELILEPYTGHIKAFFKLTDITTEREHQLQTQLRSEKDGMTGLLNRATLELRVKECMKNDAAPGVMLLVDMDDLKKINDTYGHIEGDKAIRGIAQALTTHFRQTDIIGRLGGDEFLVYLRGAAVNPNAIAATLTAFLRRLSVIPVGDMPGRNIRCSVGCAVQSSEGEEFEALYRRADIALYHVKRGAKNGFAFYHPEMEENYQFRSEKMLTVPEEGPMRVSEGQRLLDYYELVLSMNLTTNSYFLAAEMADGVFSQLPLFGSFDDFMKLAAKGVHPDDVERVWLQLSRERLLKAHESGRKHIHTRFRFARGDDYCTVEATVILYTNECGNVCNFTLLRWA